VPRTAYRRKTKSAYNSANKGDLGLLIGKISLPSECANIVLFKLSEARISPQKNFVRLLNGSALKIQAGRTKSCGQSFVLILHQQLLSCLQQYCFNERMIRVLQPAPRVVEG
jgi:hypothetical protein